MDPYANGIMTVMGPLWDQSGEDHMIKQAVLAMITAIINSMQQKSVTLHDSILPPISSAVDPSTESFIYLVAEALELWTAILKQTPSGNIPPTLLMMTPRLAPLLASSDHECLLEVVEVLRSYILLSPLTLLDNAILSPLLTSLRPILGLTRSQEVALAPDVLQDLVAVLDMPRHFESTARTQALQHLLRALADNEILHKIGNLLQEAYLYHFDPRPSRQPPDVIGPLETHLFSILARLIIADPSTAVQFLNVHMGAHALQWLTKEWLDHFDSVPDASRKKLHIMALTSLLADVDIQVQQTMLEQLQSLLTIWTDLVIELGEDAAEDRKGDYLYYEYNDQSYNTNGTLLNGVGEVWHEVPEDERKRELSRVDPIHTTNIRGFLSEKLKSVIQNIGGDEIFQTQWLSRIDQPIVKAFAQLGLGMNRLGFSI